MKATDGRKINNAYSRAIDIVARRWYDEVMKNRSNDALTFEMIRSWISDTYADDSYLFHLEVKQKVDAEMQKIESEAKK